MRALVSLTRPVWWLPAALLVAATSGCVTTPGFVRVSEIVGEDVDDLSPASLALAADRTAEALKRTKADSFHVEGGRELRVDAMIASARRVADLARDADDSKDLTRRLARACRGWPVGAPAKVTGYYEPVVDARETPDSRFRYPIYAAPGAERLRAISEKLGHAAA